MIVSTVQIMNDKTREFRGLLWCVGLVEEVISTSIISLTPNRKMEQWLQGK